MSKSNITASAHDLLMAAEMVNGTREIVLTNHSFGVQTIGFDRWDGFKMLQQSGSIGKSVEILSLDQAKAWLKENPQQIRSNELIHVADLLEKLDLPNLLPAAAIIARQLILHKVDQKDGCFKLVALRYHDMFELYRGVELDRTPFSSVTEAEAQTLAKSPKCVNARSIQHLLNAIAAIRNTINVI